MFTPPRKHSNEERKKYDGRRRFAWLISKRRHIAILGLIAFCVFSMFPHKNNMIRPHKKDCISVTMVWPVRSVDSFNQDECVAVYRHWAETAELKNNKVKCVDYSESLPIELESYDPPFAKEQRVLIFMPVDETTMKLTVKRGIAAWHGKVGSIQFDWFLIHFDTPDEHVRTKHVKYEKWEKGFKLRFWKKYIDAALLEKYDYVLLADADMDIQLLEFPMLVHTAVETKSLIVSPDMLTNFRETWWVVVMHFIGRETDARVPHLLEVSSALLRADALKKFLDLVPDSPLVKSDWGVSLMWCILPVVNGSQGLDEYNNVCLLADNIPIIHWDTHSLVGSVDDNDADGRNRRPFWEFDPALNGTFYPVVDVFQQGEPSLSRYHHVYRDLVDPKLRGTFYLNRHIVSLVMFSNKMIAINSFDDALLRLLEALSLIERRESKDTTLMALEEYIKTQIQFLNSVCGKGCIDKDPFHCKTHPYVFNHKNKAGLKMDAVVQCKQNQEEEGDSS
mmetsp:Transcript_40830/g.65581  ORF Transcript_40830/g.65581 Transcript_40830/m.65581 type:complete len:506 (-) Transcript_40830:1651-3168(-)